MGSIKDRNGMDLTEAEDIKKRKYTEEPYKKYLHDSDNHDGEIKSFTDKQKLKKIQHHQTSFTTNAKGTSPSGKHK